MPHKKAPVLMYENRRSPHSWFPPDESGYVPLPPCPRVPSLLWCLYQKEAVAARKDMLRSHRQPHRERTAREMRSLAARGESSPRTRWFVSPARHQARPHLRGSPQLKQVVGFYEARALKMLGELCSRWKRIRGPSRCSSYPERTAGYFASTLTDLSSLGFPCSI